MKKKVVMLEVEEEHQKLKLFVYFSLRLLVILTMIFQFFQGHYDSVMLCVLTLVLFLIPSFVERRLKIDLPNILEIIIYLFIFSAEILGEINSFYLLFDNWDTILHTLNGFLMGAIGFALVDILNKTKPTSFQLSPIFIALVAFCFSMTTGVVWEFFEYGMDHYFHKDMQKDTWVQSITSVEFDETRSNIPVTIPIETVEVNGQVWEKGYLDIGLIDTMGDLFVNFIGALVFSIVGFFYVKGRGSFAEKFIPKRKQEE